MSFADGKPYVREVAEITTSPKILAELAKGEGMKDVKDAVAANPFAWPQTLEKLAEENHYLVRQAVANNPSTLPRILSKLADSKESSVREK